MFRSLEVQNLGLGGCRSLAIFKPDNSLWNRDPSQVGYRSRRKEASFLIKREHGGAIAISVHDRQPFASPVQRHAPRVGAAAACDADAGEGSFRGWRVDSEDRNGSSPQRNSVAIRASKYLPFGEMSSSAAVETLIPMAGTLREDTADPCRINETLFGV